MRPVAIAVLLLVGASVQVSAQQPSFPFLQDGGARDSFVRGSVGTCIKTQSAAPTNAGYSQDRIARFCNCYARAIADAVNGQEYEAMIAGQLTDSFREKANRSSALCTRLTE